MSMAIKTAGAVQAKVIAILVLHLLCSAATEDGRKYEAESSDSPKAVPLSNQGEDLRQDNLHSQDLSSEGLSNQPQQPQTQQDYIPVQESGIKNDFRRTQSHQHHQQENPKVENQQPPPPSRHDPVHSQQQQTQPSYDQNRQRAQQRAHDHENPADKYKAQNNVEPPSSGQRSSSLNSEPNVPSAVDSERTQSADASSRQSTDSDHIQVQGSQHVKQSPQQTEDGNRQDAIKQEEILHQQQEKLMQQLEQNALQRDEQKQQVVVPPPSHRNQPVPPILEDDPINNNKDDGKEIKDEKLMEPELTEEQIEAEKLFQAGEKLVNATYYKEYKEAYLNFLAASKLGHERAQEYVAFGHLFGDYLPQNVTKAALMFEALAAQGSPKAQMGLSFMYSSGFHFNSSQAKALIFSTFGALGGDPLAQMALAYRYYAGIGVESKCESALTYYRKVATKVADGVTLSGGPVVQRIRLQEESETAGTNTSPLLDDDLLQYYHFLADKGDQQAQVVLGTLYYQGGKGVQINHEQAYHYFSVAAESGSGHALGYLGKMHSEGSPVVKQSNYTALEYFRKSADKNNHVGQAGLGLMYLNGLGVDKDLNKAFRMFSLASDQGSVDGQLQLGIMYFTGNGVRKDYKMAVKYFTMASQNGHVLAFYNLAQMHATGTGVLRNCHTAVELFKNVAERGKWSEMLMDAHRMYHDDNVDTALVKYMFLAELGYEVAQSNVAYMLDSGVTRKFGGFETHQRALLQYSRAASQGSTHARLKMGDYYYYGLGTDIDYESAASHYRMASEQQHNAQAMFNLGYMHEQGLGLKQDVHLAKRYYDMAADTSLDAHVPVTLALLKLGIFYGVDIFSKEFEGFSGILTMLDPMTYFGPQWDLYLAGFLGALLGALFFLRRLR